MVFAKWPSGIYTHFRDMRAFGTGRFLYFWRAGRHILAEQVLGSANLAGFWSIAGVILILCAAILAVAAGRPRRQGRAAEADLALYRDQLSEIDRDVARGVLSDAEAERVRVEVSRRLIDANRRVAGAQTAASSGARWTAIIAGLFVLVVTPLVYLQLGAPRYPDLPLQARLDAAAEYRATRPSQAEVEEQIGYVEPNPQATDEQLTLLGQLKTVLTDRPDDLTGFEMLANFEARLGHYRGAYQALDTVIMLKGDNVAAADWADYADLLVSAAGGYVSPEAERALAKALQIDGQNTVAGYYLGLMWAQTGRPDQAFTVWRNVLQLVGPDDPVRAPIEAQIGQAAAEAGVDYEPPQQLTGPSAEDVAAASEMSEEDRQSMIEGMVAGLMDRLATDGGTSAEWARLIRALGVLGRSADAWPIVEEARTVFANDPQGLAEVEDAATSLEPQE